MFNWLSKKEIAPISKETSISMFVLLQMEKYIKEHKDLVELCPSTEAYSELYTSLSFLRTNGLSNTKNARIIEAKIAEIEVQTNAITKAKALMQFVKVLRNHFGESTLLIGSEQFEGICKKYGLAVGMLEDYTGIIPDNNIKDISRIRPLILSFSQRRDLSPYNEAYTYLRVTDVNNGGSVDTTIEAGNALVEYLKEHNNTICIGANNYVSGRTSLETCLKYNKLPSACYNAHSPSLIKIVGHVLKPDTLFVACPPSQLKEQGVHITQKLVDPIVFQYSPYGIVIHTMWGEEAEDAVFEEYKKLNNLMSL